MLAETGARHALFHTTTGIAFVDLLVNGHRETWPIQVTASDLG
jgi:hypothetical protein